MNKYEVTAEISFCKVFEVYADDRDEAESEAEELLDEVTAFDIYHEGDWDISKEISEITIC